MGPEFGRAFLQPESAMSRLLTIAALSKLNRCDAEAILNRHAHDLEDVASNGQPDHRGAASFKGRLKSSVKRLEQQRALLFAL